MAISTCTKPRTCLEQAEHNEEVARFLLSNENFSDWIIIIQFYAAMHYVHHLILPYKHKLITGEDCVFDSIESLFENKRRDNEGRHGFLNRFVRDNYREIGVKYQRLHEMSVAARYKNDPFNKEYIAISEKTLNTIKTYCLNNKK